MNPDKIKEDIRLYDKSDMLSLLKGFSRQCSDAWRVSLPSIPAKKEDIDRVIICGMGGSGIGGDVMKTLVQSYSDIPFYVNRGYNLPRYADNKTLLIVISYSGNTEETVSCLKDGIEKDCIIVCLSSGGTLHEISSEKGIPFIKIPGGYPPRCAFGYLFFPCYRLLEEIGICEPLNQEIFSAIEDWSSELALIAGKNTALKLAERFHLKLPIIYAEESLYPAMSRWKAQVAENSKSFLFFNSLPEMNHNEIMSWHYPESFIENCTAVFMISGSEHPRTLLRIDITEKIVAQKSETITLKAEGQDMLGKLLYLIILGDWISFYLAIINRTDPTAIDEILHLKSELQKH